VNYAAKFEPGQYVFVIGRGYATRPVDCTACTNTGKVQINGTEYGCPGCKGMGKRNASIESWFVVEQGPVGRIQITDVAPEHRRDEDDYQPRVDYILRGTSGSLYLEHSVFASRDEAERMCEAGNKGAIERFEASR
jgi:hypothetical protein